MVETETMRQTLLNAMGTSCTLGSTIFKAYLSANLTELYSPESPMQVSKVMLENHAWSTTRICKTIGLIEGSVFTYVIEATEYTCKVLRTFPDVNGKTLFDYAITGKANV